MKLLVLFVVFGLSNSLRALPATTLLNKIQLELNASRKEHASWMAKWTPVLSLCDQFLIRLFVMTIRLHDI